MSEIDALSDLETAELALGLHFTVPQANAIRALIDARERALIERISDASRRGLFSLSLPIPCPTDIRSDAVSRQRPAESG